MTYTIEIYPGRDDRASNGGFHCAELLFVIRDTDCAVTFACLTNWLPSNLPANTIQAGPQIRPLDITFHYPEPTLTSTQSLRERCEYISGKCHSLVDRRNSQRLVDVLMREGSVGVWRELRSLLVADRRIHHPASIKECP